MQIRYYQVYVNARKTQNSHVIAVDMASKKAVPDSKVVQYNTWNDQGEPSTQTSKFLHRRCRPLAVKPEGFPEVSENTTPRVVEFA